MPDKVVVENNSLADIAQAQAEGKTLEQKAGEHVEAENERYKKANCAGMSAEACSVKMYTERREALKEMALQGVDFLPVVGDIKSFAEAQSALDYLVAAIGIIPGAGDVAGKAIKAAQTALKKGDVAAAANVAHNAAKYASLKMDLKTTEVANEVVESLRITGKLPQNYVNKAQAAANGWKPGKALNNTNPGGQLGGDIFENSNNLLPSAQGRVWQEADIGLNNTMSRSNQPGTRLLYSNDGLLYITTDHYETATSIGKWK